MVGVVVMAGGKARRNLVEVIRDGIAYPFMRTAEFFGGYSLEAPIRGYKPARKVKGEIDGVVEKRPMITYVIDKLARARNVEEIVAVGEENILREIVKRELPPYSCEEFKMMGKVVQQAGSFGANAYKGYMNLSQRVLNASNGYALFMFSDAVNCTTAGIERFVEENREQNADVILGVATEKQLVRYLKYFRRPPLRLVDDVGFSEGDRDENGIVGLRSADRIYANPLKINNFGLIDEAFSYRRLAKIIIHPKKFIEFLDKKLNIDFWKYKSKYRAKQLTLSEVLAKASSALGTRISIAKVEDAECSLDLDAERDIPASEKMNHDFMRKCKEELYSD